MNNLFRDDDLPRATRRLIEEKAQGNPFYVEEVVQALVDQGAVEYRDGTFRATERIAAVEIPGSVHELVMARVDALDLRKRQILQTASVIGGSSIAASSKPSSATPRVSPRSSRSSPRRSSWCARITARAATPSSTASSRR